MRPKTVKIKATRIFYANLQATKPVVLNIGGARSGKSFAILQLLLVYFVNQNNKKILITRKTRPALKISCWEMFLDLLERTDFRRFCKFNRSELDIRFKNNVVYFRAIDNPEKIKSTEFNYIFMEEANEFSYEDYVILKTRLSAPTKPDEPNRMFLAMNPVECWITENLVEIDGQGNIKGKGDVEVIRSSYKDNPFLSAEYKRHLESLKYENERLYRILALGEFVKLQNIIYDNWTVIDNYDDIPADEYIYGLDFGYNNPTALVEIKVRDQKFYIKELIYQTNLTNADLIELMKTKNIKGTIFADSAEPQRIEEIYRAGFDIHPARKISVRDGIDFVKRFKLYIDKESTNIIKEIKFYSYKVDKNGKVLDEPVKLNDHAMDAIRYAITNFPLDTFEESYITTLGKRYF